MAMVIARRSVSIFLAVWGVSSLLFGCGWGLGNRIETIVVLQSGPRISSCQSSFPLSHGGWLATGLLLLVAVVLWLAPWKRFVGVSDRGHRLVSFRLKHHLVQAGGWLLMALGVGVIVASVWGVFVGGSRCFLEIGCYKPVGNNGLIFLRVENLRPLEGPFREPLVSLVRVVGVDFGLSALVWGRLEVGLNPRRLVRQLVQAAAVIVVVGTLVAPGYPGLGRVQATAFVIALFFAVLLFRSRDVLAGAFGPLLRSLYAIPVAMGASIVLGAWLTVLVSVSPIGCSGRVRCADDLRSVWILAAAVVAAGLYLVHARWKATHPLKLDQGIVRKPS